MLLLIQAASPVVLQLLVFCCYVPLYYIYHVFHYYSLVCSSFHESGVPPPGWYQVRTSYLSSYISPWSFWGLLCIT